MYLNGESVDKIGVEGIRIGVKYKSVRILTERSDEEIDKNFLLRSNWRKPLFTVRTFQLKIRCEEYYVQGVSFVILIHNLLQIAILS